MSDAYDEFAAKQAASRHEGGDGQPRIMITVPGVEDLYSIAGLLQRAGAEITAGRRTFEIKGHLTVAQAAALMELAKFRDWNSDGNQLDIRFESVRRGDELEPLDWWAEQQRRQAGAGA